MPQKPQTLTLENVQYLFLRSWFFRCNISWIKLDLQSLLYRRQIPAFRLSEIPHFILNGSSDVFTNDFLSENSNTYGFANKFCPIMITLLLTCSRVVHMNNMYDEHNEQYV